LSVWVNFRMFNKKVNTGKLYDRQYIFNGHKHSKTARSDLTRDGFNIVYDWTKKNTEIYMGGLNKSGFMEISTTIPKKNTWAHLILKRFEGYNYLYVNGELRTKEANKIGVMDMYHSLFLGTASGNNPYATSGKNFSFNGKIDDVTIYNRALSDKEILQLSSDK